MPASPVEIEQLQTRIEILEKNGQHGIADRLRDELAALTGENGCLGEQDDPPETAIADDYAKIVSAMEMFGRIKRIVARLGINFAEDLAHWDFDRFRKADINQRDIEYIYGTMAALGLSAIIGSGDVPDTIPEPSPYVVDLMDGRTPDDVEQYLIDLSRGKPQRDVSHEMGSPRGWHQRAGSLIGRHNHRYAELCALAVREEHKHSTWLREVTIERVDVRERPWALRLIVSVNADEAAKELGIIPKAVHGGFSWRAVRVIFDTGEQQVQTLQAKATKLGGQKPWRVTDQNGVPLKTRDDKPLDHGGYATAAQAEQQAGDINRSLAERRSTPLTRAQKRTARSAQIAQSRADRGGAVHPPKTN